MSEGTDEDWGAYLHWTLHGEHVLLEGLRLETFSGLALAALLTLAICMAERLITLALSQRWTPFSYRPHARWRHAFWRASLSGVATGLRLLYMLIAMTFNISLILLIIFGLASGQFVIELLESSSACRTDGYQFLNEPLPVSEETQTAVRLTNRPRSRSKPEEIFIHPNHSNLARADARAVELGLSGDTDLVHSNRYPGEESPSPWEAGRGQEAARTLMGHASSSRPAA